MPGLVAGLRYRQLLVDALERVQMHPHTKMEARHVEEVLQAQSPQNFAERAPASGGSRSGSGRASVRR
jgi:hypothetical protein